MASARATSSFRADEPGTLSAAHKFTSFSGGRRPSLSIFTPLGVPPPFWRNGFTDSKHDPHEQDCDVAGGIDGGRAIPISSTTCIFTALSVQLVGRWSLLWVGKTTSLFFLPLP